MDSTNRIRGFTLKELVVVLGCIVLLLAIVLPSLTHAKEIYNGVTCEAHMRQISTALLMYAQDNDGWVPRTYPYGMVMDSGGHGGTWPSWSALLVTHPDEVWETDPDYYSTGTPWGPPVDYLDSPESLLCPQDPTPLDEINQLINGSYGINSIMTYADRDAPWVQGSFYNLTMTKRPDQMYLVFCNLNDGGGTYHDQSHAYVSEASFAGNPVNGWTPALRHHYGESTQVLYHDGSVRRLHWTEIRAYDGSVTGSSSNPIIKAPWLNGEELTDFHDFNANDLATIMSLPGHGPSTVPLDGDLNADGVVNVIDLNYVLANWDKSGADIVNPEADADGDGTVGMYDLNYILIDWGKTQ